MRPNPTAPILAATALRHWLRGGAARAQPARWLLHWALVWAMALAPLLGQMHRTVHAGGLAGAVSTAHAPAGQSVAAIAACQAPVDWVHALFDGHGPAGCQLLDQHHGAMAGPAAALVLPSLWASQALVPVHRAVRDARALTAFFDARAPPRSITAAAQV